MTRVQIPVGALYIIVFVTVVGLTVEAFIAIVGFILGAALLVLSSDKAVEHSINIASTLGVPPFIIGLALVSIGTDLPEIANSIVASAAGHGDINVGDSLGSVLTQMTLVLGLVSLLGKEFSVKRKEVMVSGAFLTLALILSVSIARQGYISRLNALVLIASWPIFMLLTDKLTGKEMRKRFVYRYKLNLRRDLIITIFSFIGVAFGAYALVKSIIKLSIIFNVSEYLISFFIASVGTSLPELVVSLLAIRRKEYELAVGDIVGSCIADASLSVGIGQFLFPCYVSGELVLITGSYAILASILVTTMLTLRKKLDRKIGIFFIFVYLFSYTLLSI